MAGAIRTGPRRTSAGQREKVIVVLTGRHLIRGGVFQTGSYLFVSGLLPLILTPVILSAVGASQYGLWAVLLNLGGWFVYFDLGLGLGVPKVTGEMAVRDNPDEIWKLINSLCLVWAAVFGLVIFGIWSGSAHIYARLIGESSMRDRILLTTVTAYFGFLLGAKILNNVLFGLQWVAASSKIQMLVGMVQFLSVFWAMRAGHGLLAIAVIYGLTGLCQVTALFALLWKQFRPAHLFQFDFSLIRKAAGIGGVLYLIQVLAQVFQLDRVYFALIRIPLDQIAEYHIGLSLAAKVAGMLGAMAVAIYPAASSLAALRDDRRLQDLAVTGTKYLAASGFALFGFLIAFAPEIILLWLGRPVPGAVQACRILSLWGMTSVICGLTAIGAGIGRAAYQLKSSVLAILIAIPVFLLFGRSRGMPGVAWTISISVFSVAVYYVHDFCGKILPGCKQALIREAFRKPILSALGILPAYFTVVFLESHGLSMERRMGAAVILAIALAIAGAMFALISKSVGLFSEKDFQALSES